MFILSGINVVTIVEFSDTLFQLLVTRWRNRTWFRCGRALSEDNQWSVTKNKVDVVRKM